MKVSCVWEYLYLISFSCKGSYLHLPLIFHMKIGLAQIKSETGHIRHNIDHHLAVLQSLDPGTADLVVFPELSLSNYEPDVADFVALAAEDERFNVFKEYATTSGMVIAVGCPLKTSGKPLIALCVFTPDGRFIHVGKQYLHADEIPYFAHASDGPWVLDLNVRVGLAICYELSVAVHTKAVMACSPEVYLASVAKTPAGVALSQDTLSRTAKQYGIPVLMVNSVGTCEGNVAGGGSMVIGADGNLVSRLDGTSEGLLIYDTESGETQSIVLASERSQRPTA